MTDQELMDKILLRLDTPEMHAMRDGIVALTHSATVATSDMLIAFGFRAGSVIAAKSMNIDKALWVLCAAMAMGYQASNDYFSGEERKQDETARPN